MVAEGQSIIPAPVCKEEEFAQLPQNVALLYVLWTQAARQELNRHEKKEASHGSKQKRF